MAQKKCPEGGLNNDLKRRDRAIRRGRGRKSSLMKWESGINRYCEPLPRFSGGRRGKLLFGICNPELLS